MARRSLGTLTLDLIAKIGGFVTGMGKAERVADQSARRIQRRMNSMGSSIRTAFALIGGGVLTRAIVRATTEQEDALRQLEQRLKTTGGAAGLSRDELVGMANEMQKVTTFADDAVLGMQGLLLAFTNIKGDNFKRASEAVLDLSTALGQDLPASARLLGLALNDPAVGLSRLTRAGISLDETQKKLIKRLAESGDIVGAQNILLDELAIRYGGSARAAAETFGGSIEQLKNAFGDLLEATGDATEGTAESIQGLTKVLQDPSVIRGVQELTNSIITLIGKIGEATAGLLILFTGKGGSAAVNLDNSIDRTKNRIDTLLSSFGLLDKTRAEQDAAFKELFGEGFNTNPAVAEIARLRDEYEKLIAQQRVMLGLISPISGAQTRQGGPRIAPPLPDVAGAGATEEFLKLEATLNEQIALYGKTGKAAEIAYQIQSGALDDLRESEQQQLLVLAQRYDAILAETDATKKATEAQARMREEIEAIIAEYKLLNSLGVPAILGDDEFQRELESTAGLIADQAKEQQTVMQAIHQANADAFKESTDEMTAYSDQAARNIQSHFADFIFDPFQDGLKGMVAGFIDALRRMVAEMAAAKLLEGFSGFLGGLFGGGFNASAFDASSKAFFSGLGGRGGLPGFATGGYLGPGQWGVVGENGAELAYGGNTGATIIPAQMARGAAVTQTNHIHIDSRADRAAVRQDMIAITEEGNRQLVEALRDNRSRGRRM